MKYLISIMVCCIILITTAFAGTVTLPNHQTISYTDDGKGFPIILIHAFLTDKSLWDPQRQGLANKFRVITLDLPGFGKSSHTDGSTVSMEQYAEAVNQVMEKLHIQRAIIGGESMGGYVTLAFVKAHPDKVAGIILSNSQSIADTDEFKLGREKEAQYILANGTSSIVNRFLAHATSDDAPEKTKQTLAKMAAAQPDTGVASGLRGMALRPDVTAVLATTTAPVLIITSDNDAVIAPKESENMHYFAKNSKLVVIPNAAHLSSLEKPKEWNDAVIAVFYDKVH